MGEPAVSMSIKIDRRLVRSSKPNCDPNCVLVIWESLSEGRKGAVVSQSPGSCGANAEGKEDKDVGMGIWRESDVLLVRVTWAMREQAILL